jgi:membrane dipeptidase
MPDAELHATLNPNTSAPTPAARELHDRLLVANLHDDWSIEVQKLFLKGERGALDRTYAARMREGCVDFSFYTVGGDDVMFTQDPDLLRGTLRATDGALQEIERSGHFMLARDGAEIRRARAEGQIALMFTIEGAGPIGEDLAILRLLYRLGLRSVILTWFKANPAADGVGEKRNGGLSTFGRELVAEMNRLGMLIDISQSAPATVDDAFAFSQQPVIASHSNCAGLHPHRRNLTDQQLRDLARNGGLIGLTSYPAHVHDGLPELRDFMDQVDYAVRLMGIDHVAIGLNIVVHTPEEAEAFYRRSNIEFSQFHLPGLEDVDRLPNVTSALLERGYGEAEIAKIMGGNVLRVIDQVTGGDQPVD